MGELLHSSIQGKAPARRGKVREVYDLGSEMLIVATDRISAFDVIMSNGIPDKGRVLTQMSEFWFDLLHDLCPNHMISVEDEDVEARCGRSYPELFGRSMVVRKAKPLPVECVARGYISGSLFKEYRSHGGGVHDLNLPEELIDSQQLPEPIFTPATKAEEGHDENISFDQVVDLVGRETAEFVREKTLQIYTRATAHAASKGLILADTKFEFGETEQGIIWIDEALTPDSSRYWDAALYEPGKSQASYDKQFVRDYLETLDWDKQPPGPTLPKEIVEKTREKYLECFRLIVGRAL
jgi:phosphoribosylaminoimidazole-succinocarboxamide synthase